jgi:hypothetical protein
MSSGYKTIRGSLRENIVVIGDHGSGGGKKKIQLTSTVGMV